MENEVVVRVSGVGLLKVEDVSWGVGGWSRVGDGGGL